MDKKKFQFLFTPAFLLIIILLVLPDYRHLAIVPVLLFWIAYFVWESIDKKKKEKSQQKPRAHSKK
jgi:hypothetical protein